MQYKCRNHFYIRRQFDEQNNVTEGNKSEEVVKIERNGYGCEWMWIFIKINKNFSTYPLVKYINMIHPPN